MKKIKSTLPYMREEVELYLREYGEAFRIKRMESAMTQIEVAHEIGVSQAIISHIEKGLMLPTEEVEEKLLELYSRKPNQKKSCL